MVNAGEKAAFRFFLGVDISKEKFDACCIGGDGGKLFRVSAPMTGGWFDELLMQLSSLTGPKESVLIGMESTACYHINLFSFLTSQGLPSSSKRGNRHLRKIIGLMAVKVIQFNEHFRQYYRKMIAAGLIYKKAILAAAHKLIRIIFTMLSKKARFNAKATV